MANAAQLFWRQCSSSGRLSEVALFISRLFYLNTGSRDWYMMPGRIGSKGNSAVTETPNITWRKLHSHILCLPLSLSPSLPPFSAAQPLILISFLLFPGLKLTRRNAKKSVHFKRLTRSTSLDDTRLRLWKAHLYRHGCKTLPWMLHAHSEAF